jgi:putative phage-type endonuclease
MRIKKSIERDCMEQRTEEWFSARLGKVTASRVADVLAKIKSGESASRKNYKMELVVQRLTGKPQESFTNAAMEWGTEQEPFARMAYEAHTGTFVKEEGFVDHPTIEGFGCSPDGLVGTTINSEQNSAFMVSGLIEIKCPNTANHIETVLENKAPSKYIPQMQCQMAVTGAKWCDFVSFDPRLPEDLQLFVVRVERDQEYIDSMEVEVKQFLSEVLDLFNQLKARQK